MSKPIEEWCAKNAAMLESLSTVDVVLAWEEYRTHGKTYVTGDRQVFTGGVVGFPEWCKTCGTHRSVHGGREDGGPEWCPGQQ